MKKAGTPELPVLNLNNSNLTWSFDPGGWFFEEHRCKGVSTPCHSKSFVGTQRSAWHDGGCASIRLPSWFLAAVDCRLGFVGVSDFTEVSFKAQCWGGLLEKKKIVITFCFAGTYHWRDTHATNRGFRILIWSKSLLLKVYLCTHANCTCPCRCLVRWWCWHCSRTGCQ